MFSEQFLLFQQEGFLIDSSFKNGFNSLIKSSLNKKGEIYSALFNLSIGIERTIKLLIIFDYMINNQLKYPANKILRSKGHDLVNLNAEAIMIASKLSLSSLNVSKEELNNELLRLFSQFAKTARYYNLDRLTGGKSLHTDPF